MLDLALAGTTRLVAIQREMIEKESLTYGR